MVSQNELEFIVPSGLAECQAARVHLTELADEVRVGIEVGSKAEPGPPCEAIGTMSRVMVKLSAPLGGRRVVDADSTSDQESLVLSGSDPLRGTRRWGGVGLPVGVGAGG